MSVPKSNPVVLRPPSKFEFANAVRLMKSGNPTRRSLAQALLARAPRAMLASLSARDRAEIDRLRSQTGESTESKNACTSEEIKRQRSLADSKKSPLPAARKSIDAIMADLDKDLEGGKVPEKDRPRLSRCNHQPRAARIIPKIGSDVTRLCYGHGSLFTASVAANLIRRVVSRPREPARRITLTLIESEKSSWPKQIPPHSEP